VLVLTCHEGNCHSEQGNIYARRRSELLTELFSHIGFEKDRLMIRTLASNMGAAFADIANNFEKSLLALGPSKLGE
jgi:coenzyme F420-reducing hydrogenase delta subunit